MNLFVVFSEILSGTFSNSKLQLKLNVNFRNWSSEVADLIQSKLSNAELKGADAWSEIKSACCTTVEDLKGILDGLEKFQANEFQIDQKERKNTFFSNLNTSLCTKK